VSVTNLSTLCSRTAYNHAKNTFVSRQGLDGANACDVEGGFANVVKIGNALIGITSDGIGTKMELAERVGRYDTLGFDLVAMVADDLAAMGIEPTNMTNVLDVNRLDLPVVDAMMRGLSQAALQNSISITGGELAELGKRVSGWGGGMHANWCSTAIGVVHSENDLITGREVAPEQTIITLREDGFRSNGFTMAREILYETFGERWHAEKVGASAETWGEALLKPSRIYCTYISRLIKENHKPTGIAHVTGGGIPANLGRVLKQNKLSATINNLFTPPDSMQKLMRFGRLAAHEAYREWNMGNGMLIVVPATSTNAALSIAAEMGFEAKVAGTITEGPVRVEISMFNETFSYENPGK
jgi:phosphoribosylformylglycinamidine cyclo-ligase